MRLKLWGLPKPLVARDQVSLVEREREIYALPRVSVGAIRSLGYLEAEAEAQLLECCCERWPTDFSLGVQCLGVDTVRWAWDVVGRSKRVREIRHYEVLGTEHLDKIEEEGKRVLSLSQDSLEELETELGSLMCHWSPHSSSSDYVCVFCGERVDTNLGLIVSHSFNCFGVRLQKELGA